MAEGNDIKVAGYAQRTYFNDNIEYRDFSPDLVGNQFTGLGDDTSIFTMGNFSVFTNINPKKSKVFNQGTFSDFLTVDDVTEDNTSVLTIEKNVKTQLNLDLTNPLQYVWYGSFAEFNRVSLEDIQSRWPAAIYIDNKVGSVTGNSVTNYIYDVETNRSTFKINSKYFYNPFTIKYTTDSANVVEEEEVNNLRNLSLNYGSYGIEVKGRIYNITNFTGSTQITNSEVRIEAEGNIFKELTNSDGSISTTEGPLQFFIKPKEIEIESFFTSLTEYQRNILNRNTQPIYKSTFDYPVDSETGIIVYQEKTVNFPLTKDGYNLNFFDGLYLSFLNELNDIAVSFDENQTNLMVRKYTAEVINSFDTAPRADGNDYVNNGQKATNVLNIYGREFDEVKKYITGIKYAHVVSYNKKNNTPDVLIKDLAKMLGFEGFELLTNLDIDKIFLPSEGVEGFSGQSKNYSNKEVETEVYRRIILNVAWLWKSKGTRKAVEYLFRLMGAPESVVVFDEHVYVAEKPLDIEAVKRILYLTTNSDDISSLPIDEDGYPKPSEDGDIRIVSFINSSGITVTEPQEMYFQNGGGWYRDTGGDSAGVATSEGNNPHIGPYDGGREYINQFDNFFPNFSAYTITGITENLLENAFVNYNDGYFNGLSTLNNLYVTTLEPTNNQLLENCLSVSFDLEVSPNKSGGTTTMQDEYETALLTYEEWTKEGGILELQPYRIYDPEWYVVKRNYEVALARYSQETNKAGCDGDKCIGITLSKKNIISNENDNYIKKETGPYIYYENASGEKVLFDDFQNRCVADDGVYKAYISTDNRFTEYCAKSAPCSHGEPVDTNPDGFVLFKSGGSFKSGIARQNTLESSVECCTWYNYNYRVQSDGKIYCVSNPETDVNTGDDIQKEIDAKTADRNKKQTELDNLGNS
jgi:hypothetical protein